MVGYLSKESMEAKERVASALRSIGHPLPSMKITVNLSPANIRKNGTAFDFPIAVAFLGCLNLIDASKLDDICIMGELGLNGKIRGVGNCLPIVLEARKQGIHKFFAASEDENSLRGIEDIEVVFMDSLQDVLDYFHGTYHQKSCRSATTYQKEESEEDFKKSAHLTEKTKQCQVSWSAFYNQKKRKLNYVRSNNTSKTRTS